MASQRWDPLHEMQTFRDSMERFIQEGFVRPASNFIPGMRGAIPLDVLDREDRYIVRAALPGVRPDDVQVTLQGRTLTIRGTRSREEEVTHQTWLLHEHRTGDFYRSVTLPAPVDADASTARFRHGILELTLPKVEAIRPRQIKI